MSPARRAEFDSRTGGTWEASYQRRIGVVGRTGAMEACWAKSIEKEHAQARSALVNDARLGLWGRPSACCGLSARVLRVGRVLRSGAAWPGVKRDRPERSPHRGRYCDALRFTGQAARVAAAA